MSTKKKIKIPLRPHPEADHRGAYSAVVLFPWLCAYLFALGCFYTMEMIRCTFNTYFEVSDLSQVWG